MAFISTPCGDILLMSEKFQSQHTSTQMRAELTRATSAPTLEDEVTRTANPGLLNSGKPVSKTDGTLSLSPITSHGTVL